MSDIINQNTEPLFIFDMPDDETLSETISVKGEKGEKGDPTKLSQLENDTGFVTSSTSSLTNYYTKTQIDSSLANKVDNSTLEALAIPDNFFTGDETVTGNGTSIELDGTDLAVIKEVNIYGDIEQNGTPTIDDPIAIQTVTGTQIVSITNNADQSQAYTLALGDMELCKLGNIRDYIHNNNGVWYKHKEIGKHIFDGSETGYQATNRNGYFTLWFHLDDYAGAWGNTGNIISDNFNYDINKVYANNGEAMAGNGVGQGVIRFCVANTRGVSTAADMYTWQAENPTTVYYALATPIEEEITDTALIKQLNALALAKTYNGLTVIGVSGSLPAQLSVVAFADNWNGTTSGINHYLDNDIYNKNEIDEKLGEIISESNLGYVNVKKFGAVGDGETDDTQAIQSAIDYCAANDVSTISLPAGEYVISEPLLISSSGLTFQGMQGSALKYQGEGTDRTYALINAQGTASDPLENITIENITLDCTGQIYKGGETLEDPTTTSPKPASHGLQGFRAKFCKNVTIRGCKILDLYGDGIRIERCHSVIIDGNILNDVGGGNIVSGGPTGYDDFGDGIVSFFSFDVKITNNTVINTRTYLSTQANGYICGRSGLEFEYGLATDGIYTPDYDLFSDYSEGTGLVMSNNYVYGYTKGIHLEAGVRCLITSNTVMHCNVGSMNTISGKTVIANNYFNQDNVGPAYQSGYDGYYGGVAISEYTNEDPARTNVEVNGNIFDGDTTGVHIGRSYVSVNNNTFRGQGNTYGAIRNLKTNIKGLSINGNQFYNCGVHLYHTRGANIANNVYSNTSNYCVLCEECDNTAIANNYFNHQVRFASACYNNNVSNNIFKAEETAAYTAMLSFAQTARNTVIDGNEADLTSNDNVSFANAQGSVMTNIINNNIRVATTRTIAAITLNGGGTNLIIKANTFYGCGYKCSLITTNWDITGLTLTDNLLDEPASYLFSQSGGNIHGQARIEHNIGNISFRNTPNTSGYLNNRYIQQGDIIKRYATSDNTIGVYCSQGGYYTTTTWTANTSYAVNKLVAYDGYVYKCLVAGTATVAPANQTIGDDETGADGVKWVCVSKLAILRDITIA